MSGQRLEVMRHLEGFVRDAIPELTPKEDDYWQPADLLPEMGRPDSFERLRELQETSQALSDDLLVVLIGDMITEEALPSYSMWITQAEGLDRSGEPKNAWGDWLRKWTSEENRHGDVLNRYLYLTGRVNMRAVEQTIQNLLTDGGETQAGVDPYKIFTYTSFQEIATRISHANVAIHARKAGDAILSKLCSFVASDEQRHAKAYKLFFKKIIEVDADEAMLAFQHMMKSKITMPAMYMRERGKKLGETFQNFAEVAERTKVYTPAHYTEILDHLIEYWDVQNLKGLGDKAEAAQEYLCTLSERYRKVAERFAERTAKVEVATPSEVRFTWLDVPPIELGAAPGSA